MAFLNIENTKVNYWVSGQGDPLVFLHGFLEDSSMWDEIIKAFPNHKLLTIDLPCHGQSRFNGDECSMDFMAQCVDLILTHEKINEPHVFGHSMGGYVGLELTKWRPLKKVVLVHSNFWSDSDLKKKERDQVIQIVQKKKAVFISQSIPHLFYKKNKEKCQENINWLVAKACELPTEEIIAATRGLRDREENYDAMEVFPVEMIHGDNDPIIPNSRLMDELAKLKRQVKVYEMPETGHMSIWENPDELIQIMKMTLN